MPTYLIAVGAIAVLMGCCWLTSVRLKDASIVDPLWPLLFVAVAWTVWVTAGDASGGARQVFLLTMVSVWGLRLSVHLGVRKHGEPEDPRYVAMRRKWDPFIWWSLLIVFGLQGLLASVISLPLQAGLSNTEASSVGVVDFIGLALWAVGLYFETVSDWQLTRFRAQPDNRSKVLDSGLWRYTRHPNYFGDFLVWWGMYVVAAAGGAWWTVLGPVVMTYLLMRFSGVTLLERSIGKRRPGYAEYAARTSTFFPRPPRRLK